jgi:hypothetical protein
VKTIAFKFYLLSSYVTPFKWFLFRTTLFLVQFIDINLRRKNMSLDNDHEGSCEPSDVSPSVSDKLPNTNNVIKGQEFSYAVGRKIAPGRYGAVYEVCFLVILRKNLDF